MSTITPASTTFTLSHAWHNLHHTPVLLRAIEVSLAGRHSLQIEGNPDAGRADLETLGQQLTLLDTTQPAPYWSWVLPCPCGWCGDPSHDCPCPPRLVIRHRRISRLTGPRRLDYDLYLETAAPRAQDFVAVDHARAGRGEDLTQMLLRVYEARSISRPSVSLALDPAGTQLLRAAVDRYSLSLERRDRVLEVSRTVAILSGSFNIRAGHLAEAVAYQYAGGVA